ncbi:MAG: sulfatase-like hydrolase/transferase [Myxococcota bacterium]
MRRPSPAATRALHVLALGSLALAQPLFDLLGRHVEFLVAHRVDALDLVALAFALGVGLPGALALATWGLGRLLPPAARAIQLATLGVLASAVALPQLGSLAQGWALPGVAPVAVALAIGAGAAAAYAKLAWVRRFTTVLALGVLVFPLCFLFASPAERLLFPRPLPGVLDAGIDSDAPVVVVVFDGLPLSSLIDPEQQIDRVRHPHFAALADTADWFRNATTVSPSTNYAIPAIVTGRYPAAKRLPKASDYPQNLFSVLGASHALNVFEPMTALCPSELCAEPPTRLPRGRRLAAVASDLFYLYLHLLLPADWTHQLPVVDATWKNFAAPIAHAGDLTPAEVRGRSGDTPWVIERFLERIDGRAAPTLHFVHINVPHSPYKYTPSGKEYGPLGQARIPHGGRDGRWLNDEWQVTQVLQRHLLQVRYADALLGRLRAHLEREGLWERALVVVTADHGSSFEPGVLARDVSDRNARDILPVPLFVKLPDQDEGRISERNVETIDILPTIVDALGGRLPEQVDGRSLLDPSAPERPHKIVYADDARTRRVFGRSIPELAATARRIQRLFNLERGPMGLYEIGPHRELLHRELASIEIDEAPPLALHLADAPTYEQVDLEGSFVPAHVTGELEADRIGRDRLELAVAVNGEIRAVTRTFDHREGRARFTAMVPESAFRAGRNDVEVFAIRQRGGRLTLLPTQRREQTRYSVVKDLDGRIGAVLSSRGRLYPLVADAVRGQVIRGGASLTGWAVDARRRRVADAVLMFADGHFLHASPLGMGTRKVAARYSDPELRDSGFHFQIPFSRIRDPSSEHLRFLGLSRDAASELDYERSRSWKGRWLGPSSDLTLESRDGSEGFAASTGEWVSIGTGGVRGGVERAAAPGTRVAFEGWAIDTERNLTPAAALTFVDGRFASAAPVTSDCPEAAQRAGAPQGERCGFRVELPSASLGPGGERQVRFFVLSANGTPAELDYSAPPLGTTRR